MFEQKIAVFLAAILLAIGCSSCDMFTDKFQTALRTEIDKGVGTKIELKKLTTFPWDRFYTFPPGTTYAQIERSIGFKWKRAKTLKLETMDNFNLLVFVKNKKVVKYVKYHRNEGDFYKVFRPQGYSPMDARFVVGLEGRYKWVVLENV